MAETLVKEKVCRACGADVRPQAMFCYNCGSAVAPDAPLTKNDKPKAGRKWAEKDLAETELPEAKARTENHFKKRETKAAAAGDSGLKEAPVALSKREEAPAEKDLNNLKSAASMRRRGKPIQKKRVEISWEEHDNAPNGWFILVAVVLAVVAVTIWIISTYLD